MVIRVYPLIFYTISKPGGNLLLRETMFYNLSDISKVKKIHSPILQQQKPGTLPDFPELIIEN